MKKYIYLILILFVGLSPILYSQYPDPLSFRSQALGGIIKDDLDLIYDPIELRFVDSLRLYTNLSNLTNYSERVFDNYADDEFLLGVSRQNPLYDKHWISALFRFTKERYSPEEQSEATNYYVGSDNLYHTRISTSQKYFTENLEDAYSFILNNSFLLNDITVGTRFGYGSWSYDDKTTNNNYGSSLGVGTYGFVRPSNYNYRSFNYSRDVFWLDSNYSYEKTTVTGDFNSTYENPSFHAVASVMKPMWNYEFRGELGLISIDNSFNRVDNYSGSYQRFNPNYANYKYDYSEQWNYDQTGEMTGSGFGIGLSIRRTFNKQSERKNDGYVSVGARMLFESYDYTDQQNRMFSSDETFYDGYGPMWDRQRKKWHNETMSDNGTGDANTFIFDTRFNIPLVDGVHFGLGGSYLIRSDERNTKYIGSIEYGEDFSVTDGLSNRADFVIDSTGRATADRTYKSAYEQFSIPVGIEYRFTENKKWALRFGTIFVYYNTTTDDIKQMTDSQPLIEKTTYGDGSTEVKAHNNYYTSTSSHYSSGSSWKIFTYGLGFDATDNLQIDVLGFFDLPGGTSFLDVDFFQNLRLSFVMKF
ncbi:MAG: hypothetical protein QME52_04235 [Bacteroidota bacterium]|nr:hypothetical protein [Bacteroidota bacterium]